jgi:hypothetical protein
VVKPYLDNGNIRTIKADVSSEELVWHRDAEDRIIEVLEGDGWLVQIENCLPFLMYPGMKFEIPMNVYHRVIRGCSDLIIKIYK